MKWYDWIGVFLLVFCLPAFVANLVIIKIK